VDNIKKYTLKVVPRIPENNEYYCIDKIYPPNQDGKVYVLVRIINKSETFKMLVEELDHNIWISRFSAQDAFKIGAFSNPNISKKIISDLLKKTTDLIHNKFILFLSFLYLIIIVISNLIGGKLTILFNFEFPAVLYFFPFTFVIGDILTEVYGYYLTKHVIWLGFFYNFLTIFLVVLVGIIPSSPHWNFQEAYNHIFFQSFRITIASCCAYIGSEFLNAIILSVLKKKLNGKWMWGRITGASFISNIIDSIIFCTVGFITVLPNSLVIKMICAQFILKFFYETGLSFFTCKICKRLKEKEHIDQYDYGVNYNPFYRKKVKS